MTFTSDLDRLDELIRRMETLVGVESLAAPAPSLIPGASSVPSDVVTNELITSAWGNSVADWIQAADPYVSQPIRSSAAAYPYGGTMPATAKVITWSGAFTGVTDVSGAVHINFPQAFPNGVLYVNAMGISVIVSLAINGRASINLSGVTFVCFRADGTGIANTSVDLTYTAVGW